jgi:hypothetical protein
MLCISIGHGPIKGFTSRFLKEKFPPCRLVKMVIA